MFVVQLLDAFIFAGASLSTTLSLKHCKMFSFIFLDLSQHAAFSSLLAIGKDYGSQIYSPLVKTFLNSLYGFFMFYCFITLFLPFLSLTASRF